LLETLSLVAYKQPVTRGDIEQVRGVAVSTNIMRTLIERNWVRVVGHREVPGRPAMYGTTKAFLDYFNLKSLAELPPLADIRELTEPLVELEEDSYEPRPSLSLPSEPEPESEQEPDESGLEVSLDPSHLDDLDTEVQVEASDNRVLADVVAFPQSASSSEE
jgi:segregation and condensation protein B